MDIRGDGQKQTRLSCREIPQEVADPPPCRRQKVGSLAGLGTRAGFQGTGWERRRGNWTVEKLAATGNLVVQVKSRVDKSPGCLVPLTRCVEKGVSLCYFSRNPQPRSNHEGSIGKPGLRDILWDAWPVLFGTFKVAENKGRLRNWWTETRKTWPLGTVRDSGLESREERGR